MPEKAKLQVLTMKSLNKRLQSIESIDNVRLDIVVKDLLKAVGTLPEQVAKLTEDLAKLSAHVYEIQPASIEPPSLGSNLAESAIIESSPEIVSLVKRILGNDVEAACQFDVRVEKGEAGLTFKLIMIPPDHLKETPADQRVKMIPYLEAEDGAKAYAEQVKAFCIKYAANKGVSYLAL